jgi:hypothetical protein
MLTQKEELRITSSEVVDGIKSIQKEVNNISQVNITHINCLINKAHLLCLFLNMVEDVRNSRVNRRNREE